MQRIIEQTADGSATLFVPEMDEHYHSVKGARTESAHIFVGLGLEASTAERVRVLEIGFGTGLNALLTLEAAGAAGRRVNYTAIELYPLAWHEVEPLGYSDSPLFATLHRTPWEVENEITPHFSLKKIQADARTAAGNCGTGFDVVYFDAFAPEKQPEMWSEELFATLHAAMRPGGVLTTYCAKGAVRRMLQAVGFVVERLPGPPGGKREVLRASKAEETTPIGQ